MEYKYANELKIKYDVLGSYYQVENIKYRNLLEIYNKNIINNTREINPYQSIDAIVVMMNPGSSRPIYDKDDKTIYNIDSNLYNNISNNKLVKAQLDNTQYQIMRIMDIQEWNYVKVINLSDIRNPKSKEFIEQIKNTTNDIHSIFSNKREKELLKVVGEDKTTLIILAWGYNKGLSELANKAIKKLKDYNTIGLKSSQSSILFKHPLPKNINDQKEWIKNINNAIEKIKVGEK